MASQIVRAARKQPLEWPNRDNAMHTSDTDYQAIPNIAKGVIQV